MHYRDLDLNLMIALNALLQKRSVSGAAEILNISQSACSAALARLRDHFGDELLVQVNRRMVPTPLALQLETPAREIIEQSEAIALTRPGFDPGTARQRFSILCSDLISQLLLPHALRELHRIAPGISLATHSPALLRSARMPVEEALERRSNDFIAIPARYIPSNYPQFSLLKTDYCCVAWKHNERLGDRLSADDFYSSKHVAATFSEGRVMSIESDDALGERRWREFAVKCESFLAVPAIVRGTNYLATLPRPFALALAEQYELKLFAVPFALPDLHERLVWPRHLDDDPANQWFRGVLKRCADRQFGTMSETAGTV